MQQFAQKKRVARENSKGEFEMQELELTTPAAQKSVELIVGSGDGHSGREEVHDDIAEYRKLHRDKFEQHQKKSCAEVTAPAAQQHVETIVPNGIASGAQPQDEYPDVGTLDCESNTIVAEDLHSHEHDLPPNWAGAITTEAGTPAAS